MIADIARVWLSPVAGVTFGLVILVLARRGLLSMRYTLGWLFVAACIIVGGLLSWMVEPVAKLLGISATALVLATATAALLGLTVQLSITVSGLLEYVRILAESHALLEERLLRLEVKDDDRVVGIESVAEQRNDLDNHR
jgi:low affinity Fe/Cu permease